MTKNRTISRYILLVLLLFWGYHLASPRFPFSKDWYITIITSCIYGLIAVMGHRAVQDFWAIRAGDVTQKIQKKDFLYYLRSFDILGFLCFPIFGFGWGKPTQSPKAISGSKTMQRIGIISSGCFFNFFIAIAAQLLIFPVESASLFMAGQLQLFSQINMYYCLLSLLPIPPLDGWLLYKAIRKQRVKLDQESFYGEIIILVGMVTYIMPWAIHYVTQGIMYWI